MSRNRKEKKSSGGGGDDAAWMATFADLNFLMITFFVLLLSMSSMDERRFSDVMGTEISPSEEILRPEPPMGRSPMPAIMPAAGSWVGSPSSLPVDPEPGRSGRYNTQGNGSMKKARSAVMPDKQGDTPDEVLQRALSKVRELLQVETINDNEIRVSVQDSLFFEGDEYRPAPRAREVLRAIAQLTREYGGQLQVQAHRGRWDVAAKRSATVTRLISREGVPGHLLAADVVVGDEGFIDFSIVRSNDEAASERPTGAR